MDRKNKGQQMYELAKKLFPICRSITGNGVRATLKILNEICPMKLYEISSGTKVFDWEVPQEWNISDAYIENLAGEKIISFSVSNLHVMGYSEPVDKIVSREELLQHIYTLPTQPEAIPYVTSYYKKRYGFCMTEKQKKGLTEDNYHICIDSSFTNGSLTYGEIVLPGETEEEVFFSTYVCHPSMANNEVSGPCVAIHLAEQIAKMEKRRYTYRFVFIPETIGSLTYLSQNYKEMKKKVVAGFNISCVGDNRTYSYISSRKGNTLADKVAQSVLKHHYPEYKRYSFLDRGSDERQYCAPGIDLPLCVICRSKYEEYPEYHTSLDNLDLISPEGLQGAYEVLYKIVMGLEYNRYYELKCLGEPQLGKRGLYPTISKKGNYGDTKILMNFIAYADGENDLFDISNIINVSVEKLIPIIERLLEEELITIKES